MMGEPERIFDEVDDENSLRKLIEERPESGFLECKELVDNPILNDKGWNAENYGKALSGFANHEGGILIWGVEEIKENGKFHHLEIKPFKGVFKFENDLNRLAGDWVTPTIDGFKTKAIYTDKPNDKGVVLVLIPQSDSAPHMCKHLNIHYELIDGSTRKIDIGHRYYRRFGSSFRVMEHSELDDMFGRRPKPKFEVYKRAIIKNEVEGSYTLKFGIANNEKASAHNVYCGINALKGEVKSTHTHGRVLDNDTKIFDLLFELGISTGNDPNTHPVSMPPGMIFKIHRFILVSNNPLVKVSIRLLCDDLKETKIDLYVILKNEDIIQNAVELPKIVTYEELKNYCDLDNNPNCIEVYFNKE